MNAQRNHVTVCICTYRRPRFLRRLLESIALQEVSDALTFSVVVADNDTTESARDLVAEFSARAPFAIEYCVEPQRNIAMVRNRALKHAQGEFIAFIDDDEFPAVDWLLRLREAIELHSASGVLGPVRPHFEENPPRWITQGRFCERPEHKTGTVLKWWQGRTGNVLFRKEILSDLGEPFQPQFATGGEDQDFYRRLIGRGCIFVWCNEAVAYETVPPARLKPAYMLRRALLRGRNSLKHEQGRCGMIARSIFAVPFYLCSLPVAWLGGQHWLMRQSIRLCDHSGRILTLLGMNPVSEREM